MRLASACIVLLTGTFCSAMDVPDSNCFATSIMADGREVKRSCYDAGVTKPKFESTAPSYGRFESCTG